MKFTKNRLCAFPMPRNNLPQFVATFIWYWPNRRALPIGPIVSVSSPPKNQSCTTTARNQKPKKLKPLIQKTTMESCRITTRLRRRLADWVNRAAIRRVWSQGSRLRSKAPLTTDLDSHTISGAQPADMPPQPYRPKLLVPRVPKFGIGHGDELRSAAFYRIVESGYFGSVFRERRISFRIGRLPKHVKQGHGPTWKCAREAEDVLHELRRVQPTIGARFINQPAHLFEPCVSSFDPGQIGRRKLGNVWG